MIKNLKKCLTLILSVCMLSTAMVISTQAEGEPVTVPGNEHLTLESDSQWDNSTVNLHLSINADAPSDLKIDLSALNDMTYEGSVMPGAKRTINIRLTNKSQNSYKYKAQSFKLDTLTHSEAGELSPFVGADGKQIPYSYIGAVSPSIQPIYQLFGCDSSGVTIQMLLGIYDTLASRGYTGSTALADYLKDYYNNYWETSYADFNELVSAQGTRLADLFAQGGAESTFSISAEELNTLCPEGHPLHNFVSVSGSDPLQVQIKWPEEALAAFSYNIFYSDFFSFAYGDEAAILDPGFTGTAFSRTRGLSDYRDVNGEPYQHAEQYLTSLTTTPLQPGAELNFTMAMSLDGPGVGNGYALYDFGFENSFELKEELLPYCVEHVYVEDVNGDMGEGSVYPKVVGSVKEEVLYGKKGMEITPEMFTPQPIYNDLEYTLTAKDAAFNLQPTEDGSAQVLRLTYTRYLRIPVQYTVEHQYYTQIDGGAFDLDGVITQVISDDESALCVGDTLNAAAVEKLADYENNSYGYEESVPAEGVELKMDGENKITMVYRRTVITPHQPEETPKPQDRNPNTADESHLMLWTLLAVSAAAVLAALKARKA